MSCGSPICFCELCFPREKGDEEDSRDGLAEKDRFPLDASSACDYDARMKHTNHNQRSTR